MTRLFYLFLFPFLFVLSLNAKQLEKNFFDNKEAVNLLKMIEHGIISNDSAVPLMQEIIANGDSNDLSYKVALIIRSKRFNLEIVRTTFSNGTADFYANIPSYQDPSVILLGSVEGAYQLVNPSSNAYIQMQSSVVGPIVSTKVGIVTTENSVNSITILQPDSVTYPSINSVQQLFDLSNNYSSDQIGFTFSVPAGKNDFVYCYLAIYVAFFD